MELSQIIEKRTRLGLPTEAKKFLRFAAVERPNPTFTSCFTQHVSDKTITVYLVIRHNLPKNENRKMG
jgi:hypothetical protein